MKAAHVPLGSQDGYLGKEELWEYWNCFYYICYNPGIEIFNKVPVQHSSAHLHTDSCSNLLCIAIEIFIISRLVSELAHRGFWYFEMSRLELHHQALEDPLVWP